MAGPKGEIATTGAMMSGAKNKIGAKLAASPWPWTP